MVVILILSLMGQNQSLSRRSKSSNSSWLEKLPRIKCIVQPNSLKPKKSCPYQPVIGYYDQWMKSLALKILGWFDRVYSEATSFTQTMERNCSCHRCFATLQLRSLLDDAGCIDCNFIWIAAALAFWNVEYVASICIKSVHVFFGNVRILFVGGPWLDVVWNLFAQGWPTSLKSTVKSLVRRIETLLNEQCLHATHWLVILKALFAPSWNGRCDEELACL